jgi:hypothetical protein
MADIIARFQPLNRTVLTRWPHGYIAQLLKSRLRNGLVPIAVEIDTLTAQPTLLRTSALFTVDSGTLQPHVHYECWSLTP